jgi:putative ABC transport system permease protein
MFTNYFKTAVRNLLRNKAFSFINIIGLSLSVAFCLLLFMHIRFEQSFDTFHQKKNHLFRLEMTNLFNLMDTSKKPEKAFFSFLTKQDDADNQLVFPLVVAADLQSTFPEVKSVTRFKDEGPQLVKAKNEVFKEKHILYADNNFFNNFSFKLKQGNIATALSEKNSVVLSETTAIKYFGNSNVIGNTIELTNDTTQIFTVAGIAEDAPVNSSIQYDLLLPSLAFPDYERNIKERFNQSAHLYIIELADDANVLQFEKKLNVWVKSYFADYFKAFTDAGANIKTEDINKFRWYLRPLANCHYNVSNPWGHYTNEKNIYQLACLVIIILFIASLNYILLAVSNASSRSQEVGVRKVMGANRRAIIMQFWIETQVVVILSVLAGLLLANILLPLFNYVMDTQLNFSYFSIKEIALASVLLTLILGILAGYYPALLISKMKPVTIIKSFQTFKVNPSFSRILVITQYTACVVLMVAAFVITKQMRYISNKDLGYNKEQILMVENPTWDDAFTKKVHERLSTFVQSDPAILQFSGMNGSLDGSGNTSGFKVNGEQKFLKQLTVDYNYFEMLGLKFVNGRPFSKDISSDSSTAVRSCIVNETLFSMLGKTAKLGEYNEPIDARIIGVVKDHNFESLSQKIQPQQYRLAGKYIGSFMFKIKRGETQETLAKIEKEWKDITQNYPFEYTFLDQTIAKMYEPEMRWQNVIQASCFFAVFIACMGLFGLSAINAMNRTKEIGIRKVLGASVQDIVMILSKSFVVMIAVSICIATPVAWWLMNKWLEDFAYRINISWWMFAVIGVAALVIALSTVIFQAVKAANANPADSLRAE